MTDSDPKLPVLEYDVAIIGAGPAGSAAAYFLATGGFRVVLLDKFDFPRDKICGDGLTPRAIKILEKMGILPQLEKTAFHCSELKIRYSDDLTFNLGLENLENLPNYILTMPRLQLDNALLQHAINAGAEFIPKAKVESISMDFDGRVHLKIEYGRTIECALAIVATGANTRLLQNLGLSKKTYPTSLAARAYFENVDELNDSILLFFDGISLPGYGWVFPTGNRTANIGCGVFFEQSVSQATVLRELVDGHPFLQRILKNARQVGPIKGYPLRTDFSPSLSGNERILVVGEAAGLVNPVSGEGIDYALESAHLAANAILTEWKNGIPSHSTQKRYRNALRKTFQTQFMITHLMQKLYFRDGIWPSLLRNASQRPTLRKAMIEACFGVGNPFGVFSPRTLMDIFL